MKELARYEGGEISVRVDLLLDYMSDQDKLDLAQRLSCEDEIIQHVVDQITEGATEDGSCGIRIYPPQACPSHPLDMAVRQIAKASSDIAQREIDRLERAMQHKDGEIRRLQAQLEERLWGEP